MAKLRIPKVRAKRTASPSKRALMVRLKRGYKEINKPEAPPTPQMGAVPVPYPVAIPVPGSPYPVPVAVPGAPVPPEPAPAKGPKEVDGVKIDVGMKPRGKPIAFEEREPLTGIDIYQPLIPRHPKKGDRVFTYSNMKWNPKTQSMHYTIVEPKMGPGDKELIDKVKKELEEKLDIDITHLGTVQAKEILRGEIDKALLRLAPQAASETKVSVHYYVERDTLGYGKIHALMIDPSVEDISCDGINLPIYIYHRDPRFASIKTNIVFETEDELNSFAVRLAEKCNKSISIADPLLDGTLPDGSRVQTTLGTDIARKGSNFTIRKFTEKPLTPTHMLKYKTMDSIQLAYLWLTVESGMSILISGGTATGKTALLNTLSLFIHPDLKVVSIEDTAELRLALPHWIPHVARTPLTMKKKVGEVTLFDLLKSSLRQRPDYLVLGEVRGREAFVLFQQIATGHPALATIHAASIPQLIDRLITPPISLPPSLLENIDVVVFLSLARIKGSYVRRTNQILEVIGTENDKPVTNKVFEWEPMGDKFKAVGKSVVLKKIAHKRGITEEAIQEELLRRKMVLDWMLEKSIFDYKEVSRTVSAYYTNPERIMDFIVGG